MGRIVWEYTIASTGTGDDAAPGERQRTDKNPSRMSSGRRKPARQFDQFAMRAYPCRRPCDVANVFRFPFDSDHRGCLAALLAVQIFVGYADFGRTASRYWPSGWLAGWPPSPCLRSHSSVSVAVPNEGTSLNVGGRSFDAGETPQIPPKWLRVATI